MYQLNKSESVRRADAFKITAQRKSPIIRAQCRAPPATRHRDVRGGGVCVCVNYGATPALRSRRRSF